MVEVKYIDMGKFGEMRVVVTDTVPADEALIGYPDGKGGLKPGFAKLVNLAPSETTPAKA